ncbi:MAG: indolepyruvate oxidoreductase subunit beta [Phycisphaerae bacterium]
MAFASASRDGTGWRVLIAGTGGQGVLTIARLLCNAFVERGHEVVSGQLHGMAQRGGSVQSSVIIDGGMCPVIADGRADYVLGLEPMETARVLSSMSAGTVTYMNTSPVVPYVLAQRAATGKEDADYPDIDYLSDCVRSVTPNVLMFDATAMAVEAGSAKSLNMVMLGCFLGGGGLPCTPEDFWQVIETRMPLALQEINRRAFFCGADVGREHRGSVEEQ